MDTTSRLTVTADIRNPQFGQAWSDDKGILHSTVRLSHDITVFCSDPAELRRLAAACLEAAGRLEDLEARRPRPGQQLAIPAALAGKGPAGA